MEDKERQKLIEDKGIAAAVSLEILQMLGEEPYPVKCPECNQEQFSGKYGIAVCGNCGAEFPTGLLSEDDTVS